MKTPDFQMRPLKTAESTPFVFASILLSWAVVAYGQPAPAAAGRLPSRPADETIMLTPFEVIGDPTDSYQALNTNSLVGVSRALANLPITADIFSEQAIKDLAVTSPFELLNFFAAGVGAAQPMGAAVGEGQISGGGIGGSFSMRGIAMGSARLNALFSADAAAYLDAYDTFRVEIIRGPQSLLYGAGSPAGVINVSTKQPLFGAKFAEVAVQSDNSGTARGTLDLNVSSGLAGRPFALRFNVVSMGKRYWRDILRTDTEGVALAIASRPFDSLLISAEVAQTHRLDVLLGRQVTLNDPTSPYTGMQLPVILANGNAGNILNGQLTWQNVNSLLGDFNSNNRKLRRGQIAANLKINNWLSAQMQLGRFYMPTRTGQSASAFSLVAPTVAANTTKEWAVATNMQFIRTQPVERAIRATLAADFNIWRAGTAQLVIGAEQRVSDGFTYYERFYKTDSGGNIIVNQSLISNADNGRTVMPVTYIPVTSSLHGLWTNNTREIVDGQGNLYKLAPMGLRNISPPTATNPFGVSAASFNWTQTQVRSKGFFGVLLNSWFNRRLDTLLGYRAEKYEQDFIQTAGRREDNRPTGNLGAVYHFNSAWSLYASYSVNFQPPATTRLDYKNDLLPAGRGKGLEGGLKFDLFGGRLAGSLGAYRVEQQNQVGNVATTVVSLTDPVGINGQLAKSQAFSYFYNNRAKGVELTLTAKPTKNSRVQFGWAHSGGESATDVTIPLHYNDQFNVNAAGQVSYSDGTVFAVRSDPRDAASPLLPLTITMMKDRSNPYYAVLDPANGRITNAATLGLTNPLPNGATIGSGKVGLPISAHQLGFVPPGGDVAVVTRGGEKTTGYPVTSASFTGNYTFAEGALSGVSCGASIMGLFDQRAYYYSTVAGARILQKWGDRVLLNPFVSYSRKLSTRLIWSLQFNVNNAFDSFTTQRYPSLTTGAIQWAAYSNDPRTWSITSRVRF